MISLEVDSVRLDSLGRDKNIVIRRRDIERVHDYARKNCCARDFLLIRLPMKIGLRNSEIRMLRIEDINFEDRTFQVLDSKKKEFFPLPLDLLTLELIQQLIGTRQEGYVFAHIGSWTTIKKDAPLSRVEIWQIIHDIALEAGVKGFNPRILRHYFAANWGYVEKKTLIGLQRIMRHSNLAVTSCYLSRLIFYEDLQNEFDGVKNEPFAEFTDNSLKNGLSTNQQPTFSLEESICKPCGNLPICRFAPLAPCVTACKNKLVKVTGISQYH
jgi:integrase